MKEKDFFIQSIKARYHRVPATYNISTYHFCSLAVLNACEDLGAFQNQANKNCILLIRKEIKKMLGAGKGFWFCSFCSLRHFIHA